MAAIRREGLRVVSENVSGEDVSEEFVDVQARLNNLLATEEELRKVLIEIRARTQRAADVLEVHKEITRVREDIDRLQGRTNYLKQMTAMSTVKLELIPDQLYQPLVEPGWQPFAIAMTAARSFVASMKWLGTILIWVVVFALPLGLVLAGLTLSANMIWKPIRRWRMSQQTPPQA
jgi:predicted nuclease with TOPRIM domain